MSRIAFPYPTLFPLIRTPGVWNAIIDGESRQFREGSGSWDYQSDVELVCRLGWQPEAVFEQAGLTSLYASCRIAILLSTGSSLQTGRRYVALDHPITEILSDPAEIRLIISSPQLSSKVTATLLVYSGGGTVGGMQIRSGSILYREEAALPLEGDLASFPLRTISFSESRLGDGLWLVDFSAESPFEPLLSSVAILLNSDQSEFIRRLLSEEDGLLRWIVQADVMASVLTSTLLSEDLGHDIQETYPEGSLGGMVNSWLRGLRVEGRTALQSLREEARREPGRLRQRCQSICAVMREVK
jgi:hypothetical protein